MYVPVPEWNLVFEEPPSGKSTFNAPCIPPQKEQVKYSPAVATKPGGGVGSTPCNCTPQRGGKTEPLSSSCKGCIGLVSLGSTSVLQLVQ